MAGMGPPPKPWGSASRHKWAKPKATAAVLVAPDPEQVAVPPLPDRPQDWHHPMVNCPAPEWHPLTRAWWADLWASPMAAEYDATDVHGLLQLAVLVDDFWHAQTPRDRQAASAEMRLQGVRFGLSPIDRRRLQWEIDRGEEAQVKGRKRAATQEGQEAPAGRPPGVDPRSLLRAVTEAHNGDGKR